MKPMNTPSGSQGDTHEGEDGELVQRSLQGDAAAFGLLVRRYERLVFHVAGGFLRDRGEVEDVAQEAFLKAHQALSRFRVDAPFGPWIAQIVTRLCYDRLRGRRRRQEVAWEDLSWSEQAAARGLAGGGMATEDAAARRDLAERALAPLPPKDRQALILADALGHTAAEVGQMMGCSALAVRLRLHRARRAMRRVAERLVEGMESTTEEAGDEDVQRDRTRSK
jgi:RNA polymerase sigma-70 factor (ECF subfamily)